MKYRRTCDKLVKVHTQELQTKIIFDCGIFIKKEDLRGRFEKST